MSRALGLLALGIAACAAPRPAPSPPRPADSLPVVPAPAPRTPLGASVDRLFARFDGRPGCAVGVYRDGVVAYAHGYGLADLERPSPITEDTPFLLASLSKQFTAAAILLLAQDGKLTLEDDVRRWIPELPEDGNRTTLAHLLHHTSGLRDYGLLLDLAGEADGDLVTNDQLLWMLARQRGRNFPPGTRFQYSNSGYVLLALVAERASGERLGELLASRVFGPLQMRGTLVPVAHGSVVPGRALGYEVHDGGRSLERVPHSETLGPSNVLSTVRDLARWDAELAHPTVLGAAVVDALRTRGALADGTPLAYAAGLFEEEVRGVHRERHDGASGGYRATLVRYPTVPLTIAILCNADDAEPAALADALAEPLVPWTEGAKAPSPRAPASPAPPSFEAGSVDDYAGRYGSDELPRDVAVRAARGHLWWQPLGAASPAKELVPTAKDAFRDARDDTTCTFVRGPKGAVTAVVFESPRTRGLRLERR